MAKKPEPLNWSLSPTGEILTQHADALLTSTKISAAKGSVEAAGVLLRAKKAMKELEAQKEEKTRVLKIQYDSEKRPFDALLKVLKTIETGLKSWLLNRYEGTEPLIVPDEGEVSFREKWEGTIMDPSEVPMQYWSVDYGKVATAVDNGLRVIPGIQIEKVRTVVVKAKGEE
jgi:hypothetical protein